MFQNGPRQKRTAILGFGLSPVFAQPLPDHEKDGTASRQRTEFWRPTHPCLIVANTWSFGAITFVAGHVVSRSRPSGTVYSSPSLSDPDELTCSTLFPFLVSNSLGHATSSAGVAGFFSPPTPASVMLSSTRSSSSRFLRMLQFCEPVSRPQRVI